ncbi:ornithine decarboxylase [Phakopsora pachyrhizi]|uniref:Ornithine decarboxylase n=1 Tax=Phakopsora pachyrhizi TaxID=170000 RepID=A0AAV0BM86_PHAPC|nr:ornithine decarboxylase [Phakopsora pachyrhizi]CAH7688412.1 ornithine decarboxylase [Phakopsora pachyrhizi]
MGGIVPPRSIPPRSRGSRSYRSSQSVHPLPAIQSGPTLEIFRSTLNSIDLERCEENGENAFYVCDLAQVYKQLLRWNTILGDRIEPFFAVKCNPDIHILRMFSKLGLGFDCASHAEIDKVLSLGVSPSKIIYANPCKAGSFIRHARSAGVEMMTFDNIDELQKVAKHHSQAKLVLRILTDDSSSLCRLGEKFGAPLENVRGLLEQARDLSLDVIGIAFHVGSGCSDPNSYTEAVGRAKWAFELAAELGFKFNLLDVGGGFGDENFSSLAAGLLSGLDEHFPVGCGVRVIAEPGRYFVTKAFELATNIIARRLAPPMGAVDGVGGDPVDKDVTLGAGITLYYVNDGVYGAFNCIIFDHQVVKPKLLTLGGVFYGDCCGERGYLTEPMTPSPSDHGMDCSIDSLESIKVLLPPSPMLKPFQAPFLAGDLEPCKIFGPSCDSIDLVCPEAYLPVKYLKVGDWIRWSNMGAYTICAASQFNGFKISEVKYTIGDPAVEEELRNILEQ